MQNQPNFRAASSLLPPPRGASLYVHQSHDLSMRQKGGNQHAKLGIYIYLGTFPSPFLSFYLMAPKKKGGVSRKVRITGPYTRPEAELAYW